MLKAPQVPEEERQRRKEEEAKKNTEKLLDTNGADQHIKPISNGTVNQLP